MADTLFDLAPTAPASTPPAAKTSAQRRLTIRQAQILAAGYHPLSPNPRNPATWLMRLRLHPQAAPHDDRTAPGRRCGNCWHRRLILTNGNRLWPKCTYGEQNSTDTAPRPGPPPRVTKGAATDCRAWWPACTDHVWGDPGMSDDAARYVPEAVS